MSKLVHLDKVNGKTVSFFRIGSFSEDQETVHEMKVVFEGDDSAETYFCISAESDEFCLKSFQPSV